MYGIWYYTDTYVTQSPLTGADQIVSGCIINPSNIPIDAKWKAAKSFSIICPIFGGIATFWVWLAQCVYRSNIWKCIGTVFIWCSLFSGLTLLFMGSNACTDNPILAGQMSAISEVAGGSGDFTETCALHWGANCTIAATVLWFLAGVSMFKIDAPTRPPRPPPETQTVTYTKTTQADGTELVTQNVVKGVAVEKEEP